MAICIATNYMNKNTLIVLLVLVLGAVGFLTLGDSGEVEVPPENHIVSTIHKDPSCGCCGVYGSYMDKMGYQVQIENTDDILFVKERLSIPKELESCHTTEIQGYVIEGHIPNEAIEKLLTEKPDIKGIGMQGMPAGSPGMPGPKTDDFVIYEITHEGSAGEVFMTI